MIDTITTHASEAPARHDAAVAAPGFRMRWWMVVLILVLSLSSVLGGTIYCYLRFGWFESDVLGQTLQLKRIHQEGLSYRPKHPWGFFPRAEGLLREPFTDNAWSITSADGYRLYHQPATWWAVPLKRIPKHVRAAFIFQEDQRFEQHAGVDPRALVRAMAKTLTGKRQGASTIPMQVAKHCLLDYGTLPARRGLHGVIRKGRNMLLAWRLVHVEGREKILQYYLNHATMGPGELRGIGPAAWSYCRKKPHELSLGEATQLAVLLRSPSRSVRESQHRTRYEVQRKTLLRRLYDAGAIDRSAYHKALQSPKIYPPNTPPIGIAMPQSVATAFRAIDPMFRQLDLGVTPQALRYQQPFPLHVRVSLHAELSWRFDAAMAPALDDPELKYAVVILVDGLPVVLFGGHLDLYHYVFQARRQVGSVSKLFFYDAVWQLGYIQPHIIVADGDMSESLHGEVRSAVRTHQ